jgi:hypothetical protein
MGILHMIPQIWKVRIKLTKKITVITFENIEYMYKKKPTKKSCQYFYRKKLLNHFELPTK